MEVDEIILQVGSTSAFNELLRADGLRNRGELESLFATFDLFDLVIESIVFDPLWFAPFAPYMQDLPEEELLAAKHILSRFADFDSEEEARINAEALLIRARAGENFDMLIATYGQDPGMIDFPHGYTFTAGFMDPAFENATRNLAMGAMSDLVRSSHGYHIILRVEPDPSDILRPWGTAPPNELERQAMAVVRGFEARVEAQLTFLPALDNVRF